MSFADTLRDDRRLVILRVLDDAGEYSANDSVLHLALAQLGHAVSRDVIRGDLSWLQEQGLLSTEALRGGQVTVATLTERGQDVANGRTQHPGVRRPSAR